MRSIRSCVIMIALYMLMMHLWTPLAKAANSPANPDQNEQLVDRRLLFDSVSHLTGIPWHILAAIDQYDRTMRQRNKDERVERDHIAIHIPRSDWVGATNPDLEDNQIMSIRFFDGIGQDGDGDGKAELTNDIDVLYTRAQQLLQYGTGPDDLAIGLWELYQNTRSVQRILQFAKMYEHMDTLNIDGKHAFPLPLNADYTYRSTWGAARSYGGYRIHEGTDIFARYGVPVRSTCYGVIETKGWNRYGGWRIGIRDINNVYHYFAHLSGFDKHIQEGDIVEAGQVIGWVGNSGYGKPGTQGKFPPHLHYGVYRDAGLVEWSFDPYPLLRKWERENKLSHS